MNDCENTQNKKAARLEPLFEWFLFRIAGSDAVVSVRKRVVRAAALNGDILFAEADQHVEAAG